jgi:Zn finger protein HypA/HybF involved in hydrogenase expression
MNENAIYIDTCSCDNDEHELLVTANYLTCPDCGEHQPRYTD